MTAAIPRIVRQHDYPYCAAATRHLLREREDKYPALVTAGKLTASAAAEGLERLRCIVAQWKWVIDPACPPAPPFDPDTGDFGAHNYLLAAEMRRIATATRRRADHYPDSFEVCELADLCEALAWYQADLVPGLARIVAHVASCRARTERPQERLAA
ncbi:hypothetical protein U1769_17970 [Sphingomonas sp. ZT3P38]|uniref:hypothetical protein n=1 Tax=Parasphingomonas zepuensis TaxID=3096161 RepID=UPI002FC6294F